MGEKRRGTLERVPHTPQNFSRLIFCCPESVFVPGSGFLLPASCFLRCINGFLPLWCLKGGVPSLLPTCPAFSLRSFPHPPCPPFPAGRGGSRLFHARGFAPCIPATEPARHWEMGANRAPGRGTAVLLAGLLCHCGSPAGGTAVLLAGLLCRCGARRGAQWFWSLVDFLL